jgi:hypothetical protein
MSPLVVALTNDIPDPAHAEAAPCSWLRYFVFA